MFTWEWLKEQIPGVLHIVIIVVAALVLFFIGRKLIKLLVKVINRSFERSSMDEGVRKFLISILKIALNILLIVMLAGFVGFETTSLAAVIGSAGLAIGLSLQGSLSNFAGGVLILIIKPFVIGDYIVSDGVEGTVTHIDIFYTRLTTADNKMIVIPNGTLSNAIITNVTNQTERRVDVTVGIEYKEDYDRVKKVLMDIAKSDELIMHDKDVDIFIDSFDESAITIKLRVWTATDNYWAVKWGLHEKIKSSFDENNISIPFNQLDVNIVKDN